VRRDTTSALPVRIRRSWDSVSDSACLDTRVPLRSCQLPRGDYRSFWMRPRGPSWERRVRAMWCQRFLAVGLKGSVRRDPSWRRAPLRPRRVDVCDGSIIGIVWPSGRRSLRSHRPRSNGSGPVDERVQGLAGVSGSRGLPFLVTRAKGSDDMDLPGVESADALAEEIGISGSQLFANPRRPRREAPYKVTGWLNRRDGREFRDRCRTSAGRTFPARTPWVFSIGEKTLIQARERRAPTTLAAPGRHPPRVRVRLSRHRQPDGRLRGDHLPCRSGVEGHALHRLLQRDGEAVARTYSGQPLSVAA
jgi:hypothetical protein